MKDAALIEAIRPVAARLGATLPPQWHELPRRTRRRITAKVDRFIEADFARRQIGALYTMGDLDGVKRESLALAEATLNHRTRLIGEALRTSRPRKGRPAP